MAEGSAPEMRVAIQIIHPGVGPMKGKKRISVARGSVRVKPPPSTEGLEDMKNCWSALVFQILQNNKSQCQTLFWSVAFLLKPMVLFKRNFWRTDIPSKYAYNLSVILIQST